MAIIQRSEVVDSSDGSFSFGEGHVLVVVVIGLITALFILKGVLGPFGLKSRRYAHLLRYRNFSLESLHSLMFSLNQQLFSSFLDLKRIHSLPLLLLVIIAVR